MALGAQLGRLARHSAIYGLGGLVSRILAVLLLPLYTRYLSPSDYGAVETLVALSTVLVIVLRFGLTNAFFRFYFDLEDAAAKLRLVRTSFWFTMTSATAGLVAGVALAGPISAALAGTTRGLVIAAFVGLWAQMNYEQLTSLFRVEERSVAFALASLANVLITVGTTVLLVVVFDRGPLGVVVGNFVGTLCVYLALLAYRREQLGLAFDRGLLREMNRFGMPLVPSALALWAINFLDRILLNRLSGAAEVGLYSLAVRVASVIVFLFVAFRTAWPAFAYSIRDEGEARRTYGFVLTYVVLLTSWISLALGVLAPWIVHVLASERSFYGASRAVALLSFASAAYAAYTVVAIGVGRSRRTQWNWAITGAGAVLNVVLNVILIPPYGMLGAAIATVAAYVAMLVGMIVNAQRVYPVPYQWRRVVTAAGLAVGLCSLAAAIDASLPIAILLTAVYPLALAPLGFYLPAERRRLAGLVRPG